MSRHVSRVCGLAPAVVVLIGIGATAAQAQPAATPVPPTVNVEVDPIRCWWRTSAGAVRVGEPFSIVLTCAVIENDLTTVVPDQSRLEPTALQLPPFEVMGGTHFADSHTADRRFFQYEYRVRLIKDDVFGSDAPLPEVELRYRIQTKTPDGASVEGRDLSYILPVFSMRVLSLVPDDATDIRDSTAETFSDLDAQAFRANVLRLVAAILFSLGVLMAVLSLVRFGRTFLHREAAERQPLQDAHVLRRATRELTAIQQRRKQEAWSDELAGRALTALRIVGAYALGSRTSQVVGGEAEAQGYLAVPGGLLRRTSVLVSGAATAASVERAMSKVSPGSSRHTELEQLQVALARFAAVRYGRDGSLDDAALDESLDAGVALARKLAVQHLWPLRKLNALRGTATGLGRRVWSR